MPELQLPQLVDPDVAAKDPEKQLAQFEDPLTEEKVPLGQFGQTDEPIMDCFPAPQREQLEALDKEYVPESQNMQTDCATFGCIVPAAQLMQTDDATDA